jgi:hypothetical protein
MKRHSLINMFNGVTKVRSLYMNYTNDHKFTGYAFVSVDDTEKALSLNGTTVNGRTVYVKGATKNSRYVKKIRKELND